jgi:DNA-binding beta-propeller fold protein YncE
MTPLSIILLIAIMLAACKPSEPTVPLIGGPITITPLPSEAVPRSATPIIPTGTPEPTTTRVLIDGLVDDWAIYPTLLTDWEDDAIAEGFDLKSVRAFTNDHYLYLMLDSYGVLGDYVQIELDIDIDSDGAHDYIVSFDPRLSEHELENFTSSEPLRSLMMGTFSAEGEVVEVKLPIGLLGGVENFIIREIRVMVGQCCEADWIGIDEMGPVSVVRTNELEMTFGERYAFWSSASFSGPASSLFIINDKNFEGPRGLVLDQDGTRAYVINQYSGELSLVDLDSASPNFSRVSLIKEDVYVLNDISVNQDETLAYLSREEGPRDPPQGQNVITKLYLESGEVVTLVDQFDRPTNFVLSQDESQGYVIDLARSGFYELYLGTSVVTPIATGLDEPYAVDVDEGEGYAYIVTKPPGTGEYPLGSLLRISLQNGRVTSVAHEVLLGPTSITLASEGRLAFITEYGHGGKCDGSLSVINIDSKAAGYGNKLVLLPGLCGPHDVVLDQEETMAYFVEVESSRLGAIQIDIGEMLNPSP